MEISFEKLSEIRKLHPDKKIGLVIKKKEYRIIFGYDLFLKHCKSKCDILIVGFIEIDNDTINIVKNYRYIDYYFISNETSNYTELCLDIMF